MSPPPASAATDADLADGDEVFAAARQTLQIAETEPDKLRALFTVVNLQRRRGDFTAGLAGAEAGLTRARALGDLRLQIDFLYLKGRIHWNLTQYPQSLESHLEELQLAEQLGDASVLARTHGGLGLTYYRYGRNQDALHHFQRGLSYAEAAKDDRIRSSILNSLGNYYMELGDYDRAETIHEEALKLRESFGNRRAVADSLTNLGLIADARGDTARALDFLQRALQTFEMLKYRRYITNTHRRLARVLRKGGRLDEALTQAQTALRLAASLNSIEVVSDIYEELALTHEARGEFAQALDFERKWEATREEMRNVQDRQHIDELRTRYRAEQRELEIALLKREQDLQQVEIRRRRFQNATLALGLVVGVLFLGTVSFVQMARLRAERRMHTATEHARERAESAQQLKSRLLQMASHDLKVPLTSLNATAALIGTSPGASSEVQRLAAGIQSDTSRMRSLVRDFLDAAAREDGNLQLHSTDVDLDALAREAVDLLQPVATQKTQRLVCLTRPNASVIVQADPDRLHQVFDNLIGNALKFTPTGGQVSVTVGTVGAWGYAEVCDNGPGFGPADFARIFSSGFTPVTNVSGEEDSTGLGLFITRELLTLQGGRLEMQSKPGAGAVFRVLLPLVANARV
ncbi:MAG: tetratricopeptide repeat protein [Cephaloticoccus sp.]|nr:tetratricopeptide repeat protein [Cephaloticoccus sp.]MCF7760815.1 tetratricopeptide repeat protein [Cephaloticoccus sp.]